MQRRLLGLMRKEFIQFFRDKALTLFILYFFLEAALCGWALTLEVRNLPIAIYDGDRSVASRELVEAFARQEGFILVEQVESPHRLDQLLDTGQARFALIIPAGFARSLAQEIPAQVQLLMDGSYSSIAGQTLVKAQRIVGDYNAEVITDRIGRGGHGGGAVGVANQIRVWYMPYLKYVHYIMLTMLTISVLLLGAIIPAAGIVREKEAGTFEQLMITPTTSIELIAAKTLPVMLLKMTGLALGVGMSMWLFNVPLRGNILLFFGVSILMFLSSSGLGVLIATIAQNMQQTLLLAFIMLFPLAFLSGTMVPIDNMPVIMQWLSYLGPLRFYVDITLGIFLKGVGLEILWPQVAAMTVYGAVLLSYGALRFRSSLA